MCVGGGRGAGTNVYNLDVLVSVVLRAQAWQ